MQEVAERLTVLRLSHMPEFFAPVTHLPDDESGGFNWERQVAMVCSS